MLCHAQLPWPSPQGGLPAPEIRLPAQPTYRVRSGILKL